MWKGFSEMQLMVTLCVCRPYPNISDLLRFMREQIGFIRVIVISLERSPKEMMRELVASKKSAR